MPDEKHSGALSEPHGASSGNGDYNRKRSRRRGAPTYAALDLGTNNCRLLIARPQQSGFKVVDSYSRVVHLGKGLTQTGRLSEASMAKAIDAISVCARKMKSRHVKRWRCVATQACRQAENGDTFLKTVKERTGITLDVISPRVEARLSVMGCINLIDTTKDVVLVVDIGGGSTELSWVDVRRLREEGATMRVHRPPISAWASLPLGVVSLSELEPEHDNRVVWYEDLKNRVRRAIEEAGCGTRFSKVFNAGQGHIIGTSGTITSLAAVHLKLPSYRRDKVDGLWLPRRSAIDIARDLSQKSLTERAREPSIGTDRAALLVAGCAIMDVICEIWPSERLRVADRGLREGIIMGLMRQSQKVHMPEHSTCEASALDKRLGQQSSATASASVTVAKDSPTDTLTGGSELS